MDDSSFGRLVQCLSRGLYGLYIPCPFCLLDEGLQGAFRALISEPESLVTSERASPLASAKVLFRNFLLRHCFFAFCGHLSVGPKIVTGLGHRIQYCLLLNKFSLGLVEALVDLLGIEVPNGRSTSLEEAVVSGEN